MHGDRRLPLVGSVPRHPADAPAAGLQAGRRGCVPPFLADSVVLGGQNCIESDLDPVVRGPASASRAGHPFLSWGHPLPVFARNGQKASHGSWRTGFPPRFSATGKRLLGKECHPGLPLIRWEMPAAAAWEKPPGSGSINPTSYTTSVPNMTGPATGRRAGAAPAGRPASRRAARPGRSARCGCCRCRKAGAASRSGSLSAGSRIRCRCPLTACRTGPTVSIAAAGVPTRGSASGSC